MCFNMKLKVHTLLSKSFNTSGKQMHGFSQVNSIKVLQYKDINLFP